MDDQGMQERFDEMDAEGDALAGENARAEAEAIARDEQSRAEVREQMIAAIAEWGIPARNTSLLSDAALEKMYLRYMPEITESQIDDAFEEVML